MAARFADRAAAGRALVERLAGDIGSGAIVLGLPRGGVVVAAEVADRLGCELDLVAVRKLGLPGQPELAMGAVAALGDIVETVRTEHVLAAAGVGTDTFEAVRQAEVAELRRQEVAYRGRRPDVELAGREVVLVDDGLATGATMRAALAVVRRRCPARVVVAVPVCAPSACDALDADAVVCVYRPERFRSVGQAYTDFAPTSDDAVRRAMAGPV